MRCFLASLVLLSGCSGSPPTPEAPPKPPAVPDAPTGSEPVPTPAAGARPDTTNVAALAPTPRPNLGTITPAPGGCQVAQMRGEREVPIATLPAPCGAATTTIQVNGSRLILGNWYIDGATRRAVELSAPEGTMGVWLWFVGDTVHATASEGIEPVGEGDAAHYERDGKTWPAFRPAEEDYPAAWQMLTHLLRFDGTRLVEEKITGDPAEIAAWRGTPTEAGPGLLLPDPSPVVHDLDGVLADGGTFYQLAPRLAVRGTEMGLGPVSSMPAYSSDGSSWRPLPGAESTDDLPLAWSRSGSWVLFGADRANSPPQKARLYDLSTGAKVWEGEGDAFLWPWDGAIDGLE